MTAEVTPPAAASADRLLAKVLALKGRVDAVNVTDAAAARAAMSSLAAAVILARNDIEPVFQLTCRSRNRIAIASDLMGAAALDVRNVLVLRGDDPTTGDQPEARAVDDLDSCGVIAMARRMRDDGTLPSGRVIDPPPRLFIGAAATPTDPGEDEDWLPPELVAKLAAGAGFVQTQFCFDIGIARRYMARLTDAGLSERASILMGVGPIASGRSARWMRDNLPGVQIPDAIVERLERASDPAAEGRKVCIELIQALREVAGVAGVHIMAPRQSADAMVSVIEDSGILNGRPVPGPRPAN
ncbi:MAG: methylenetetrahydrofolate reductase [Alphaproteobacteria bacterium]